MTKLLIVESPAKAKKIAGFLGDGWRVEATRGHVRDLPATELGVDVEADFRPHYVVLPGVGNRVRRLLKAVRAADAVYLATDPDREGEAIAWHLLQLAGDLKGKPVYRAVFNAVTQDAVLAAIKTPRSLDTALVEAQAARRIVDRLVGYLASPLACKALDGRLSAGRVQSAALRLVTERERQIDGFTPETYWTLRAVLDANDTPFEAKLHQLKDADVRFTSRETAEKLVGLLRNAVFWAGKTSQTLKLTKPSPPFTTSTLQQAAARGLDLSPERTMALAQTLYEAGRITYHRTDSVSVADRARVRANHFILEHYGVQYLPDKPPVYQTQATHAQEAHEAIRPTDVTKLPDEKAEGDGARLYALIWRRFVASQMAPARDTVTEARIHAGKTQAKPFPLVFKASHRERTFDGFTRVYQEPADADEESEENSKIPLFKEGQPLSLLDLPLNESQTRPPPRFTEAALVAALETNGIGRPSTFASIVSTIQRKKYVVVTKKRLVPTDTGRKLCDFLVAHFPDLFDLGYTARLEADLDRVAAREMPKLELLRAFWEGFQPQLTRAAEVALAGSRARSQPLGEACPQCGGKLVERHGSQGPFVGCANDPDCTYTRAVQHKPLVLHPAEAS